MKYPFLKMQNAIYQQNLRIIDLLFDKSENVFFTWYEVVARASEAQLDKWVETPLK